MQTEDLIREIVRREWNFFQETRNIGGRASCQDDPTTFAIMRRSQFTGWSDDTLKSYLEGLDRARDLGCNPIAEKYAWMMESTSPAEFAEIADKLPSLSEKAQACIRAIVEMEISWEEECDRRYPHIRSQGRPLRASQDGFGVTSFETYLKGELKTCTEKTLELLLRDLKTLKADGKNLAILVLDSMVRAYGHESADALEAQRAAK